MPKTLAVLIAAAAVLATTAGPASAERSVVDSTPGCVDTREYNSAYWVESKVAVEKRLGSRGRPALFNGEVDFETSEPYINHSPEYVKYVYPGCTGYVYVIYQRPNKYHSTRVWVQMRYRDFGYPAA